MVWDGMGCMGWDVRILYSTALAGGGRCHITCQVSLSAHHHQGIFPGSIRPGIRGEGRRNDWFMGSDEGLGLTGPLFCLLSLMFDVWWNWMVANKRWDWLEYLLRSRSFISRRNKKRGKKRKKKKDLMMISFCSLPRDYPYISTSTMSNVCILLSTCKGELSEFFLFSLSLSLKKENSKNSKNSKPSLHPNLHTRARARARRAGV